MALQVELLEKMPDIGFLFTEFSVLKDDGRQLPKGSKLWLENTCDWSSLYSRVQWANELDLHVGGVSENFPVYTGNIYRQFIDSAYVLTSTAVVRRDALEDSIRFTEGVTIYEDWEFYARLSRYHTCAFVDIETAINRGHSGPRLTGSSYLVKTQRYLSMIDQLWGQDPDFKNEYPDDLMRAEGRALLAVARAALLASQPSVASKAVARWRSLKSKKGLCKAWLYSILSFFPGGGLVLKLISKVRTVARILTRRSKIGHYPVNPAV